MKVKENVTLYKCDYCNKSMQRKHAMELHELWCSKNPENSNVCSMCSYLEKKEETIDIYNPCGYPDTTMKLNYFFCNKLKIRLHPLKCERLGMTTGYAEQFEDSTLFKKECEHLKIGYGHE